MLIVVGGPMFAGKTTWLVEYAAGLPEGSYRVFKPSLDTRYAENACVTHDGLKVAAENVDAATPVFPDLPDEVTTILLDELNFFNHERLQQAITEQLQLGRTVAGVGLLYDAQKQEFGATAPLSRLADQFVELRARCDGCAQDANHTYRKVPSQEQVVLGASDIYGPCCESCWTTLHTQSST